MIGVLDSGVGGLSVLREIQKQLPTQDIIYIADQANLPYGTRPLGEVQQFTEGISRYLIERGASIVVIACNTASAAALHHMRQIIPDVPFVGLEPAIRPAARDSKTRTIGVIATEATFQGKLYASLLDRFAEGLNVVTRACPELVLLAERGAPWTSEDYTLTADILKDIREAGADQLVLGCTHFTFVTPLIQAALGENTTIIDPAPAVARQVERVLTEQGLMRSSETGSVIYLTTGDPALFHDQIKNLLGIDPEQVGKLVWRDGELTSPPSPLSIL